MSNIIFFCDILRPPKIAPIEIIPKNTIKSSWDNSPRLLCLLSKRKKYKPKTKPDP